VEFDNSRKGSVDSLLVDFLSGLNAHPDYFSLSSCSGRICLVGNTAVGASDDQTDKVRKKGCSWLHIAHNQVSTDVIWEALNNQASEREVEEGGKVNGGVITLKFEPFILHVQCRDTEAAKRLHTISLEAGYRNSGITLGKSGKVTLAVRSTHGLEVPLTDTSGSVLVDRRYVDFVVGEANRKLAENEVKFKAYETKVERLLKVGGEASPTTTIE